MPKFMLSLVLIALSNLSLADLVFHHPVIQPTVPGIKVSSVYVTIENTSNDAVVLKSYQSSAAKHVELHESTVKNSRMVMRKMDEFTIKGNDTVALKPGSYHLMLIALHKRLKAGDLVKINLTDSKGKTYEFQTAVMNDHRSDKKQDSKMDHSKMNHSGMDHSGMNHAHH